MRTMLKLEIIQNAVSGAFVAAAFAAGMAHAEPATTSFNIEAHMLKTISNDSVQNFGKEPACQQERETFSDVSRMKHLVDGQEYKSDSEQAIADILSKEQRKAVKEYTDCVGSIFPELKKAHEQSIPSFVKRSP